MRIVFPTNEDSGYLSKRGAHFGKANYYTIITVQDKHITDVESVENQGHSDSGCGGAITNIMALNPDALVVSGIGGSPAKGFEQVGLKVFYDAISATVLESVNAFIEGRLEAVTTGTCSTH